VAFTSSSTVRNYCILTGRPGDGQKAAAIGPITEATARECGFDVVVRPAEYTIPALAAALSSYFGAQRLEARAS
jgi:uroporphyrinogen III methyltransferase/synthase